MIYFSVILNTSPTYNYFRFAPANSILNLQVQEVYDMADVGTTGKMQTKITGISSLDDTEPQIRLGIITPPPLATYVIKTHLQ